MNTLTAMQAWMRAATPEEKLALAQRAGTSKAYIHHLAAGTETKYRREPKAALAAAIEREAKAMHKESAGRLPLVWRTDLNSACRQCDFARRCLGDAVVTAGEFPIVEAKA